MASTKARVMGVISSYDLKIRKCQYATFTYHYDRGPYCINALEILCSLENRIEISHTIVREILIK